MRTAHRRFLLILALCFGVTLLPMFLLNLALVNATLGNTDKVALASAWQQQTQGVTYAPTLSDTHLFKTLRLDDRLPEIDTVVMGSSTALGITADMFPGLHAYNYAQTGHGLSSVLDDADYFIRDAPQIKTLIIPLDWSIGFIYQYAPPNPVNLSRAANSTQRAPQQLSWLSRAADALSYPRMAGLIEMFKDSAHTPDPLQTFSGYFRDDGGAEYRCSDGTPAKDYDIVHRGTCTGFRFDGSATFASSSRVSDAHALIAAATASNSKYFLNLRARDGKPDAALLERLAGLAERAQAKGVRIVLFMPPLLPGMEQEFLRHPELGPYLRNTHHSLYDWAGKHKLFLFDAGQSERFGCDSNEFLDEHHAVASCYSKIFSALWRAYPNWKG
ncbi:MAG: hypothetical protein HKM01_02410 [Gallionella sp.]|nr:hypothetical protein [Gallionella sp.]